MERSCVRYIYTMTCDQQDHTDTIYQTCSVMATVSSTATHTTLFETPVPASIHHNTTTLSSSTPISSNTPTSTPFYHVPTAPFDSTQTSNTSTSLSAAAKAGLISGISVIVLFALLIIFEFTYMRRVRRNHALRRAVEEVERGGVALKTMVESRSVSKENMNLVLESRVEILVVEEDNEDEDNSDEWDERGWGRGEDEGWEADMENEDEERGRRGGRNGMSLPRREY